MIIAIVGLVVAGLALAVSVWSVVSTRRTALRQVELQQRLLALETSREQDRIRKAQSARVRAAIQKVGRDWQLLVVNEGEATARNLKVAFDGEPLFAHTLVVRGQDEVTKLGPGAHARYLLAPAMDKPTTVEALVTWDDDASNGRSWESQLTL